MVKNITISEIKEIAHRLALETLSWDEPIPPFETRFPQVLESCVAVPFQKFETKNLYSGLLGKAAVLFYLLIKNHPFQNGNKRLAVTTLFVFLLKNKKWLKMDYKKLYNHAVWVASSPPEVKDQVIKSLEILLKKYLVDEEELY